MMNRQELARQLALGTFSAKEIDALIAQIMPLPKHAPVTGYRTPARSEHSTFREKMQRGSEQLGEGIERYLKGMAPNTPTELLWSGASGGWGKAVVDYQPKQEPVAQFRQPCRRCGVRHDKHDAFGCRKYVRGSAA